MNQINGYDNWKLDSPDYPEPDFEEITEYVYENLSDFAYSDICADNDWHADDDFEKVESFIFNTVCEQNLTTKQDALAYFEPKPNTYTIERKRGWYCISLNGKQLTKTRTSVAADVFIVNHQRSNKVRSED